MRNESRANNGRNLGEVKIYAKRRASTSTGDNYSYNSHDNNRHNNHENSRQDYSR